MRSPDELPVRCNKLRSDSVPISLLGESAGENRSAPVRGKNLTPFWRADWRSAVVPMSCAGGSNAALHCLGLSHE